MSISFANALSGERREIRVNGIVQGVGFRPFVSRLANDLGLSGFVRNVAGGVLIEVEGRPEKIQRFIAELSARPPMLARVETLQSRRLPPRGETGFFIRSSSAGPGEIQVPYDVAPCADCVRELFDPKDRRYGYPFLNCSNCGPRLTIIEDMPYDRANTSMAVFPMCLDCRAEYKDPSNRRFHAQPTACPACGPQLACLDSHGRNTPGEPLQEAVAAIHKGKIVAIKGIGGYHLACDAADAEAVRELRRRKRRNDKPFAVMVGNLQEARRHCTLSQKEAELLSSPEAPIVLCPRLKLAPVAEEVHLASPHLGLMLPSTPLHHLLLRKAGSALVMTSGNVSDEPIAFEDFDAFSRLSDIADLFLVHDRLIRLRCDDSVAMVLEGDASMIRRSRGYAPRPLRLHGLKRPALAVGAQLKSVFALGSGGRAFLSQHLGDLDDYGAYRAFVESVGRYERLFAIKPETIVCDFHPDLASTRYAVERSSREGLELIRVQHHHAHLASALAEHRLDEPAIGVAFDGTGAGLDGAVWGGEFLVGDCAAVSRAAHLRYVPMPGGEQAVREPWRMALSHLFDAGLDAAPVAEHISSEKIRIVQSALKSQVNAPRTSSMGRLFDAVSALLDVRPHATYEGQAAAELEWLASTAPRPASGYPFVLADGPSVVVDTRPLVAAIVSDLGAGLPAPAIARRFHATVADIVLAVCLRLREKTAITQVALTGGVFVNRILSREAGERLASAGFSVLRHRLVPANDGGICLGQLAVAAAGGGVR